jgi:putative ABC transport system ATP-binding protein
VFHAGEVLFHQGDTTDSVYVIDEGMVDVIIVKSGKEIVLGQLGRHQLVGEMGIFRNALRSATIRAQGMVKALKIDADVFLRAVTGHPGAALAVMRALSDKLAIMSENYQKMSNLASPAAQK